jgi:hypothetical protein
VKDPTPAIKDEPIEWEVTEGAPVVDGAGTLIGTVSDPKKTDDGRRIHTAKFNYGMTKVIRGKLFVYAFTIRVKPDPSAAEHESRFHQERHDQHFRLAADRRGHREGIAARTDRRRRRKAPASAAG